MKTLAALLFSVVSLAACATDPEREHPGMIDKDQNGAVDVTIGGEAGEWLEDQVGGDQRPVDDLSDALDIRGQGAIWPGRTIGELDDKIQGQVGAPRPTSGLDDKLEDRLAGLAGGSRSVEELGEELTDRVQQLIEQRHVDGALDDAAGEWAEEIILGERLYTLIHGPNGQHFLIDALGNQFVIRGPLSSGLPQR